MLALDISICIYICCVNVFRVFALWSSVRMAGLHEDNNNLKLGLSKVEAERKQVQERSNNLEKVSRSPHRFHHIVARKAANAC